MPLEITIASLNAVWSESVALDGNVYRMKFEWNTRTQSWAFDFATIDGTVIIAGIKVLPQINLLARHKDVRLPKGYLYAFDEIEGDHAERPTKSQLGNKLKLYYITQAEVDALP